MMRYLVKFAICAVVGVTLVILADADAVDVLRCDAVGNSSSVNVTGCTELPCTFQRGKNYSLIITLTPKGDSKYLQYNASAQILGLKIPLQSGNICEVLMEGQKCPIQDGVTYRIKLAANVPAFVPPIRKLIVNATIEDEFKNLQFCGALPARIVI